MGLKLLNTMLVLVLIAQFGTGGSTAAAGATAAGATAAAATAAQSTPDGTRVMFTAADDPWEAYVLPAAYSMVADAGKPQQREHQGSHMQAPAGNTMPHRQAHFTITLPPGAKDVHLKLARHEFVFGAAYQPETAPDLEWYNNMTAKLFWALTPENQFKWFNYEPQPGAYMQAKRTLEDTYIKFAQQHRYTMIRGHALEWCKTNSFWPHTLDCDSYVAALKERVTRDVAAFRGKFNQYDVFNEVIKYAGILDDCSLWDTAFPDAFKWAAQADPDAQLCINDFDLIEGLKAPVMVDIIKNHILAHGAPIHCIGIQAHLIHDPTNGPLGVNMSRLQSNLDLLASTGLDLYITEFSLFSTWTGPNGRPISYLDEDTQAETTVALLKLFFSHRAVKGVVLWGWWDANLFIENCGIYRKDRTPKKAALAVQQLWEQVWNTELHVAHPGANLTFTGFHGMYSYSFSTGAKQAQNGRVYLSRQHRVAALGQRRAPSVNTGAQ